MAREGTSQGRKRASSSGWHRGSQPAGLGQGRRTRDGAREHQDGGRRVPHGDNCSTGEGAWTDMEVSSAERRSGGSGRPISSLRAELRPAAAGDGEARGVDFPDFQEVYGRFAWTRDTWVVSRLPRPRGSGSDVGLGLRPANHSP